MSEASQKLQRFKFDPGVFPPLPESVLVALGDSAARHAFMGLGTDPDLFGWRYIEPAAQIAFDEWRASGCSFMLFGDWVDAIVELAIPRMIGERKHLNPVVQAELLVNSDPLSDLLVKSHEIHLERVRFLNGHLPDDCLEPIDFAVVAAWRKMLEGRAQTADPQTGSGEVPLLVKNATATAVAGRDRRQWVCEVLKSWNSVGPKNDWCRKDIAALAGYSESQLRHWVSGNDRRAGNLRSILPGILGLTAIDANSRLERKRQRVA